MTAPVLQFPVPEPAPVFLIDAAREICSVMADARNWERGEMGRAREAIERVHAIAGEALAMMRTGAGGAA